MVILAPGDLAFGMARMFEVLTSEVDGLHPVLAREEKEARAALRISAEDLADPFDRNARQAQ